MTAFVKQIYASSPAHLLLSLPMTEFKKFYAHYELYFDNCSCARSWQFPRSLELSRSFSFMNETDRKFALRCIFLCMTAPLVPRTNFYTTLSHQKKGRASQNSEYTSTKYVVRGRSLCLSRFVAIIQVSRITVSEHARSVSISNNFELYSNQRHNGRKGQHSQQTMIAISFLRRNSEVHWLPCPNGWGAHDSDPLRRLPIGSTTSSVHEEYNSNWADIASASLLHTAYRSIPDGLLTYSAFHKV